MVQKSELDNIFTISDILDNHKKLKQNLENTQDRLKIYQKAMISLKDENKNLRLSLQTLASNLNTGYNQYYNPLSNNNIIPDPNELLDSKLI